MAILHRLSFTLLLALLFLRSTLSADPSGNSPSPAPEHGGDSLSSPPTAGAPSSPSPSPLLHSPPAPPPSELAPGSSPAPAPTNASSQKSPVPSPAVPGGISHENDENTGGEDSKESSGGLNGGQKAGIAVGVIVGACVVGFGGILYKKRQQNIQRSQFGYAARREIL